jgi:4-amino-4-deoxy-L-arabinose transferase-like glycosyltransferase
MSTSIEPSAPSLRAALDRAPVARASTVATEPRPRVPPWAWPVGIVLVATVLRVWSLNHVGFNSDEVVYSGQAAALADKTDLSRFFPVFRAHPLLFQSLVSLIYRIHMSDFLARLASAAFGVGTVVAGFYAGRTLYGRRAGLVAAAILAAMPYLVIVNRQLMLDGPMVFFATVALALTARFAITRRPQWLYAASAALGLTVLTKETGIILVIAVYAFVVLTPGLVVRLRDVVISLAILCIVMLPFPLAVLTANRATTGREFFLWQLVRRPNHGMGFYLENIPQALGITVVVAALVGFVVLRRERSWRETLLLCWIVVPVAFFALWPVKGYTYLLPIAPPVAVLAARALARLPMTGRLRIGSFRIPAALLTAGVAIVIATSLLVPSWRAIAPPAGSSLLAGAGGVPGGRETGRWMAEHVPEGAQVLTLGPSMANIVQYYGLRKAYGLSVSSNELHRNPVYEPVPNPDRLLRQGDLQYLVWDAYSASRSTVFSAKLRDLASRYHGTVVHREYAGSEQPVIVVYQVRP